MPVHKYYKKPDGSVYVEHIRLVELTVGPAANLEKETVKARRLPFPIRDLRRLECFHGEEEKKLQVVELGRMARPNPTLPMEKWISRSSNRTKTSAKLHTFRLTR